MPIFEYEGKKYNVRDEHIDSFMKDFPDATSVLERGGKKYRVRSADYRAFMSEQEATGGTEQPEIASASSPATIIENATVAGQQEQPAQLTEQEKARMSAQLDAMGRSVRHTMDAFNERTEDMEAYRKKAGLGFGQTVEGGMRLNPQSGKMEQTYLTPAGNRYGSKALADLESFKYRQAADMSVGGQLRRAHRRLEELKSKREERAKEVHEEWAKDYEENKAPLAAVLAAQTYVPLQQSDRENSALDVAIRQTEELIKDLEEQKDREQGIDVGFWRGFGRVVGDFRTWDFGMSDLRDALTMMHAEDLKGENATEGEREAYDHMMGAIYEHQQADELYGGNASFWNRAGMMTGYMPSFMLDFALTGGGYDAINVAGKATTKGAVKVIGKEAVEQMTKQGFKSYVKANGLKGFGQYAGNWTIKALGTTADDLLIRAPLMTNTVQAGSTAADIIDRKLGDVVIDENGNYDFSNDKTWDDAVWQGEANAIIENYSEMFGAHLDPVMSLGNMSKLANVIGAKRLGSVLAKADAGALGGIMGRTQQLFNKMGVSDYVGEVSEEYYGQLWRTMLNLDDAYQQNPDGTRTNLFATGQFHGDIWGGMALSMGLMGAGKATMTGAQYTQAKHNVNKADRRAAEMLGTEIWEPLRATLDLTTNENFGDVADAVVNDPGFTDGEKAAVLDYMERSMYMRGFNLGTMAKSRTGGQDGNVQQADESYIDGYNISSDQEMNDAKNLYDYHRQKVSGIVGGDEGWLSYFDNDPIDALHSIAGNEKWSEDEVNAVRDYINAKQVYDGMMQRVRDDIDGRIGQSDAMVDARVNRTTAKIQGAVMKQDDRKVYVVSGNLVTYDDGTGIDLSASDNSIIVRDAETGALEQVSPDAILSIDEQQDPAEQKEIAAQAIREQYAQEAADKIDGIAAFNPGDTYTLSGEDGQPVQVRITANEQGIVDNGDGTVNVTDGTNVFLMQKDLIQEQVDAQNMARVAEFEHQRKEEEVVREQAAWEEQRPQYAINDRVTLQDADGNIIHGQIADYNEADGMYVVDVDSPIDGKYAPNISREQLDDMVVEYNGKAVRKPKQSQSETPMPTETVENAVEESTAPTAGQEETGTQRSALERIPKDMQGQPIYEQADSDTAWDAIVEQTEGDEAMAQNVAVAMLADKEAELKKIEKSKPKGGISVAEKIAAERERKAAVEQARQQVDIWKRIAGTPGRRKALVEAERRRQAEEAAAQRRAEEERMRAEREEAERMEREALNGVPDIVDDTPQNARARGYRRVNGHKIDRQEPVKAVKGKSVEVKFSDNAIQGGRVAVIDAGQLQPSHLRGLRNPQHFIDEAQPKERNDEASIVSADRIAGNIRPEEITSSVTAYTGAPTVNARGEVIQGNNRSSALRQMWDEHPGQAERYRQYLKDHAEEFGLSAGDIDTVEHPVLVNMLDVEDNDAITLGQYVAQDTESGGTERIKPRNAVQRMGKDMNIFANLLLRSADDEASFSGLVDANGHEVLKWMSQRGFITPTQYRSAFDSKGNLTGEAKNDLKGIMYQSIFQNGNTHLEEMFNALPVKVQRAILSTAYRDYDSPNAERMIEEIQDSIRAYHALSHDPAFAEAKNFKDARVAVEGWKRQYQIDDVTGEGYLPADNFSNFALHLATMYKGESQGLIQSTFNRLFDLVQGTQEENLFEQPDNTPRTLVQAIKETLNIDYNGQQRSNVLAGDSTASGRREQGGDGTPAPRGRTQDGNEDADRPGGTARDSGGSRNSRESGEIPANSTAGESNEAERSGLTREEALAIIASMEEHAEVAPEMELTIENWDAEFGEDGIVQTPIGEVKMGDHQYTKMMRQDRNGKLGMVKPTLENPDIIVEDSSEAKEGDTTERASSYVFVKAFTKADGSRYYYFTSVTVSKYGHEVVVSNQEKRRNVLTNLLMNGKLIWKHADNASAASDVADGLYSSQGNLSDPTTEGTDAPQTNYSESKGSEKSPITGELGEKVANAEAETDTNPTDGQKEAGNYKKGHVQIEQFDVSIENPKGSVRSGVDANGKKWEQTMHNTYGYIRGTEGVDGDHIDVFLSDEIDSWNGRRVFVIDQYNEDGTFDEHKVMLGFNDEADARAAYLANYESGWADRRKIVCSSVNIEDFEKWIDSSHRKTKPFAEYKTVKKESNEAQNDTALVGVENEAYSRTYRQLADRLKGNIPNVDAIKKKIHSLKSSISAIEKGMATGVSSDSEFDKAQRKVANLSGELKAWERVLEEINTKLKESEKTEATLNDKEDNFLNKTDGYTVEPAQYTTKKGKVLDMHLVKFSEDLTKEQQRAAKELAKAEKGWYDAKQGGFMMRSEDSARKLADTILGDKKAVTTAQPVSMEEVKNVTDGVLSFGEPTQSKDDTQGYKPVWQYNVHIDRVSGHTTISRDDVSGIIPIGDGAWKIQAESPEEMLEILGNPLNKMDDLLKMFSGHLNNMIITRETDRKKKDEVAQATSNPNGNRLVTDERYAELRERMRKKLGSQMNIGIDPEILAIGTEMAVYHLEKGARKFTEYAKVMIVDLGDAIRPYLKAFYNGARNLPEVEENDIAADMTPYDEVQSIDVANFDNQTVNALATAETVTREEEVEKEVEVAQERIKKPREFGFNGYKIGDKVMYTPHQGKQEVTEATIYDFEAYGEHKPVLDTGLAPVLYEVVEWSDIKPVEKKKSQKKSVTSQSQTGDLFGGLFEEAEQPPKAEQKEDAAKHRAFAMKVKEDMLAALDSETKPYRSIIDLRKRASELGMEVDNEGRTDILLQELVEDGLVRAAREVIEKNGRDNRTSYDLICKLYHMQPTIAARSSNRIKMQQYSTPLPMAWAADYFAMADNPQAKVLEPTAGNGMLVFAIPAEQVHANELDETRLDNLREQGFAQVTQQDATEAFEGGEQYDAIIANPPFGKRDAIEYDGKMIPGLDPQITLNALSSMRDNGKAAIIIGGNMEYASNGGLKSMKPFFTYLYDHYNIKGVIDMDGKLYAKQGTTYPTRMILIDGRRSEEERAQSAVYPPTEDKALRKAESFEDLFEIVNEVVNSKEKTNGTEILRSRERKSAPINNQSSGRTVGKRHSEQPRKNDTSERGKRTELERTPKQGENVLRGEHREDIGNGEAQNTVGGSERGNSKRSNEPVNAGVGTERVSTNGVGLKTEQKKRSLTEEKLSYRPHNGAFSLNSVAPAAMVEAMDNVLSQIETEYGNIDEFVKNELGYDTIEEAHQALAAEQMDSVAMAIYQMKKGQALIIGDQTGVGKGRQMAALIRWAVMRGEKPVFITQKADLFSDIYRDLVDIGSGDLVPFIFNSDGAMVDSKGNTVHKPLSSSEMAKVFATGVLPDKYDFAVLTYSQVNTGDAISQKELDEVAKERGTRTKKSKAAKTGKATPKATFLRSIAEDNYLFLDESHTAAGTSNTGAYLQSILRTAKAATFASATFAKRPDTMPLYAIRTAMSQAKVEPDKMIGIIEKGGVTLQEIMSRELTNAGQMVRRERDMSDVKTDCKTIDDPETVRRARENYDRTIAAFNAIIKFQEDYVKPKIAELDMELAITAESAGVKRGTDKMGVENVPFASKTYNYTKQLMLALKIDAIANEVEAEINAGRHPVIALESTMESSIKEYVEGEVIEEPTFSASLLKGLDSVMQYTVKDEDGNETHARYTPQQLGKAGEQAFYELQDFIRESTSDIFISPLDAIIERLYEKGFKVGELTGRNMYVERNDNGEVVVRRRTDKDKKRMQREFNDGTLDVLILNKSASTGISLHASERFSDQRQRTMIIAQPLSDINDYMQMIGRIDRTGQVHRGYYINLGLPVPAENRFLMMLSTKLKSLNANTTTSQDSESNEVDAPDLLNKYGSQVVVEYLRDNPDVYEKMGAPLKKGSLGGGRLQASELDEYKPQEDDARKITGYVALLSTKEQEEFYDDVVRRYNELVKYLNDTGSNDLKITVMPLRATTLEKRVSSEGIDPNGSNPFARNSYVEKVEMDVLRKPMKADDIRKTIEQINKGYPTYHLQGIIETIQKEDEARISAEEVRHERAMAKAVEDIAKQKEKINRQQKRTEEEKQTAIANYKEETENKVAEKHRDNLLRINNNSDQLQRRLRMFEVGKSYLVPETLDSMMFDFASPAIFCGYKAKDRKITASTTLAVFATLDGRRRVEIKLSDIGALQSIEKMTNDNWDAARSTTLDTWDSQIPQETRKQGYIMTGNILQAIADTQDEHGGYPGQLISYTDIDGNVHDGILMPDKWDASMLKSSGAPLSSRMQQIKEYKPITSHDGKVSIMGSSWAQVYYLTVPKTKKDGAIYFENKTLLNAAGGNFYPHHGQLRADIPAHRIEEVVKVLTQLGVKVKEEPKQDNGVLYRSDDRMAKANPRAERREMARRVRELAEKLHLDNVEVVTTISGLDGKKARAKGFYTKSTGKITVVIPNNTSVADAEQTLLHEAVAHYGLRQLFGKHFDTFLDNVFANADEDVRRRIVELSKKHGWNFRKATEEYLASLAERTNFEEARKTSWWQKIKDFFVEMLDKIGLPGFNTTTLSDNELRYILWRSYENLRNGGSNGVFSEAADIARQYELGVGGFAPNDDTMFRDGNPEVHERVLARDRYEQRVRSGIFQSREALQDSMLGLKEAMAAILGRKTRIEDVEGFENAYLGENRLSSVNKAEADAFAHLLFKPLLDEVARLARTEVQRAELTDYMMAKHGLERNRVMAERDAQKAFDENQKAHPHSQKTLQDFIDEYRQKDYAGLTALTGLEDVADAEAEALTMVADYEAVADTSALWGKVNAVSKAILQKSYDCGMMGKETFDSISAMYEYYIPLRGFDEKTSAEAYAYLNDRHSAFNAPIKKAEGRTSKADDPFANLQGMAESAISQGNRNKLVKQRFLNFVLNHPSDLASVSDLWVQYDDVTDEWKPVFPDNIEVVDTPDEVERKMQDFEGRMKQLAESEPDRYKKGRDAENIPYRVVQSNDLHQHQVVVKRGGRDYVITINGNPRAAQALNGLTNPDNDTSGAIGAILRAGERVNRQLSAFYTTRNPDFIVSNFLRDMLYTNSMVWIKENPAYALRFHRNYARVNPVRLKILLAKYRKGTLDMNEPTEMMFHQFMMNGGETGYANIRDIEQHKNDIRRELKKAAGGKLSVRKAWSLLGERFDEFNRAVENCARFAAYMTSREMGRSLDRSIYDAKEISVNFNKKGSGAKFYDKSGQTTAGNTSALISGLGRSGYVFWNAAIQGTANFGRQAKRHPAKAFTGMAAMFLLGAVIAYLGGDGDDDDDKNAYYNLPEYVRRSNILFRTGNSWVSIPLPVEYRAIYGMGELMMSAMNGKEHLTGGELAEAIAEQMSQMLPIDFLEGGGGLNAFVPSAAKPLWEAYVVEKSWTGMPLYKDTEWNKDMPEWTKAYSSANKHIVNLAAALNEATGGDPYTKGGIDFNPAKVEYLLNGYFGGVAGTIDKLTKTAETVFGDREYDPRSILLVNRVLKAGDERTEYRAVNNEYFRLKEEHDRLKTRLRHYEEDTDNGIFDYAEKIDFLYNSPEYERYEIFESYQDDLDALYEEMKESVDDEERKEVEAELNELKKEMIQEMNLTRKSK